MCTLYLCPRPKCQESLTHPNLKQRKDGRENPASNQPQRTKLWWTTWSRKWIKATLPQLCPPTPLKLTLTKLFCCKSLTTPNYKKSWCVLVCNFLTFETHMEPNELSWDGYRHLFRETSNEDTSMKLGLLRLF